MRSILLVPALLATASCGLDKSDFMTEDQVIAKAQIERILRDPKSATYDDVTAFGFSDNKKKIHYNFCGSVNAKNGFGGFAGAQDFLANRSMAVLNDGSKEFGNLWERSCQSVVASKDVWF